MLYISCNNEYNYVYYVYIYVYYVYIYVYLDTRIYTHSANEYHLSTYSIS